MLRCAQETRGNPQARVIRVEAMQRFADFFRLPSTVVFEPSPFMQPTFEHIITPRLQTLPQETAQSPSALLELALVWASDESTLSYLAEFDLALKALDVYLELFSRGKARAEKTGEPDFSLDRRDKVLWVLSEAIGILCQFGRREEAEKAKDLASKMPVETAA